eukprot:COSAG02_NODE_4997_length_4735_cov_5.701035_3_plen_92_part_00
MEFVRIQSTDVIGDLRKNAATLEVVNGSQPVFLSEFSQSIETPRGVSNTFSPLKSEFAFDKLVLTDFLAGSKYTSLWQTTQYQSRRWAGYQ